MNTLKTDYSSTLPTPKRIYARGLLRQINMFPLQDIDTTVQELTTSLHIAQCQFSPGRDSVDTSQYKKNFNISPVQDIDTMVPEMATSLHISQYKKNFNRSFTDRLMYPHASLQKTVSMMQNSRHASLQNVYPRKNPGCDSHEKDITPPMVRTKSSLMLRGEQHAKDIEKDITPHVARTKSSLLLRGEQHAKDIEKDITPHVARTKSSLLLRGEQHAKDIPPPVVRTKSSPLLREQYPRMTDPQKTPECDSREKDVPVPHVKDIFKFRKSAADSATEIPHFKDIFNVRIQKALKTLTGSGDGATRTHYKQDATPRTHYKHGSKPEYDKHVKYLVYNTRIPSLAIDSYFCIDKFLLSTDSEVLNAPTHVSI
jgi:hypothetical protein